MLWEVEPHPKIDYQYTHDGSLLIPGLFAFYNMVDKRDRSPRTKLVRRALCLIA